MSGQRGQRMSGLPKLHAAGPNGGPLCKPKPRKWGHLLAQRPDETDCELCKRRLAATTPAASRKDCPDCADGVDEYGENCWTCGASGEIRVEAAKAATG